jgi:hypothetical protein
MISDDHDYQAVRLHFESFPVFHVLPEEDDGENNQQNIIA